MLPYYPALLTSVLTLLITLIIFKNKSKTKLLLINLILLLCFPFLAIYTTPLISGLILLMISALIGFSFPLQIGNMKNYKKGAKYAGIDLKEGNQNNLDENVKNNDLSNIDWQGELNLGYNFEGGSLPQEKQEIKVDFSTNVGHEIESLVPNISANNETENKQNTSIIKVESAIETLPKSVENEESWVEDLLAPFEKEMNYDESLLEKCFEDNIGKYDFREVELLNIDLPKELMSQSQSDWDVDALGADLCDTNIEKFENLLLFNVQSEIQFKDCNNLSLLGEQTNESEATILSKSLIIEENIIEEITEDLTYELLEFEKNLVLINKYFPKHTFLVEEDGVSVHEFFIHNSNINIAKVKKIDEDDVIINTFGSELILNKAISMVEQNNLLDAKELFLYICMTCIDPLITNKALFNYNMYSDQSNDSSEINMILINMIKNEKKLELKWKECYIWGSNLSENELEDCNEKEDIV